MHTCMRIKYIVFFVRLVYTRRSNGNYAENRYFSITRLPVSSYATGVRSEDETFEWVDTICRSFFFCEPKTFLKSPSGTAAGHWCGTGRSRVTVSQDRKQRSDRIVLSSYGKIVCLF